MNYEDLADRNALAAIHAQIHAVKAQEGGAALDWSALDALIDKLDADGVLKPRPVASPEPEVPIEDRVMEITGDDVKPLDPVE